MPNELAVAALIIINSLILVKKLAQYSLIAWDEFFMFALIQWCWSVGSSESKI